MGGSRIAGVALVGVGLLMLLELAGVRSLGWIWSLALLGLGGALLWSFFDKKDDSGKVFTGSLLVLLGFFFIVVRSEKIDMSAAWPFFVMAPGLALLVMSRADVHRRDASVPGWIAIGIALVLFFFTSGLFVRLLKLVFKLIELLIAVLVPLGLIALGGWMLFGRRGRDNEKPPIPEKVEPVVDAPSKSQDPDDADRANSDGDDEMKYEEYKPDHGGGPASDRDPASRTPASPDENSLFHRPVDGFVEDDDFEGDFADDDYEDAEFEEDPEGR